MVEPFSLSKHWLLQPTTVLLWSGAITFYALIVKRLYERSSGLEDLPIPEGEDEFLWGHERKVYQHEPGITYRRWISHLGLTFRMKAAFGARDVLVLSDRGGIHHILTRNIYNYPRLEQILAHSNVVRPRIGRFLGKGLGWVEGADEHRRMKRIVAPSLTAENTRAMASDIKDATSHVINDLESRVAASSSKTTTVNALEWATKLTLNAIGRAAFMLDFDGGKSGSAEKILAAKAPHSRPAVTFGGFLTLMLLRRFSFMNYLPIPALKAQGSFREAINQGVLEEILRRQKGVQTDGKDLLGRLLQADIPTDELYAQISTFIISGHETTALTLTYSIYELARHSECQDKLREELEAFQGEPTYDDFQTKMPYLDACLKETLRLYSALPYMERTADKADVIPLDTPVRTPDGRLINQIIVRPGQTVIIPIIAIQRLDSVWKDPDTFKPERWLNDLPATEKLQYGWSNLLAFSDGPRACIGFRLAIYNYKAMMSTLVRRFRFSDTGAEISLKISSAIQPWVVGKEEFGPHLPVNVQAL